MQNRKRDKPTEFPEFTTQTRKQNNHKKRRYIPSLEVLRQIVKSHTYLKIPYPKIRTKSGYIRVYCLLCNRLLAECKDTINKHVESRGHQ